MIKYKNNQTVKFILPLITGLSAKVLLRKEFLGAFIGDVEAPQYDGKVLLAYRIPKEREGLKLEIAMRENINYYTSYDYDQYGIVVYVFNLPENSIESIEAVLDGKYSSILPEDKVEITKFWEVLKNKKNDPTIVEMILDEDQTNIINFWKQADSDVSGNFTKGEYWYSPKMEEEIFYIEEYE